MAPVGIGFRAGPVWQVVTLALAALAVACAPPIRPDPFLVPPGTLRRVAEPIVLAPTLVPEGLGIPESVPARIDALVAEALSGAGIAAVPAREFSDLWQQIVDEIGGIIEAKSGERDSLRYADAMDVLRDELWKRYGAGSILYPELVVVAAPMSAGKAQWDGTTQYASRSGLWADLFMLLRGRENLEGWIDALSLWITIETAGGVEVYAAAAGIQLLQHFDRNTLGWVPIPSEAIGDDLDRVVAAVWYALAPLLDSLGRTVP